MVTHPSSLPAASNDDLPFSVLRREAADAPADVRAAVSTTYRRDERDAVQWLLSQPGGDAPLPDAARILARTLVEAVREKRARASGVDALMQEFSLSSEEGVALMCLAEALLRIPDRQTADRLIADKISKGDWRRHLGESPSLFVNAATWGLLVTGKLVGTSSERGLAAALTRLIAKGGEPLIRQGVDLAMRLLGNQFVCGQTIAEALKNGRAQEARGYRYSYDMLGEAALTADDAQKYFAAYEHAIHAIGHAANGRGIKDGPGISVKLSALHPRYVRAQRARVMTELLPRLKQLVLLAKQYDIGINIDAEEADRLELSLDLIEALAFDPDLAGFDGIGLVVQAYQKRCPYVIDYVVDLAHRSGRKFMVRLVKGAYWDAEIKRAQVDGMPGYPVYTRKVYTDVSYLVCARRLLAASDVIYPQFATHNALTLAAVYTEAQAMRIADYEFQCLHGMGETLYDQVVGRGQLNQPCRIYAPVGSHETLLAYLVRRLLENGANSSFVHQLVDEDVSIETLLADPVTAARKSAGAPHPKIALPRDLYEAQQEPARKNSAGLDLSDETVLRDIGAQLAAMGAQQWHAVPLLASVASTSMPARAIVNPAWHEDQVGTVIETDATALGSALADAAAGAAAWQATAPAVRAAILLRAADSLESQRPEFIALAVREAGKTLSSAIAEVREAVDFLRYYALQISDRATHHDHTALGPVACISPWNFPLAIFTGQVSAALAAGNAVLAKPAEQTPIIAWRMVQLLHAAGVPRAALQFLPGRGETVGAALVGDARVRGVVFTGSTDVAQHIHRTLAQRAAAEQCELPLIAETGGQNAMIVDSSALPEQVVQDAVTSAFDSAGQRCSALRVLCLQDDIADRVIAMLKGALRELKIGNPDRLATDIGPVIDREAQQNLQRHIAHMQDSGKPVFQLPLPQECNHGSFIAPTVIEIDALSALRQEVFGPVLHVLRYRRERLPQLVDDINATGYGLTMGIHSRIDETIDAISASAHVGNIYVNRNMIGAVVGVQPFGGEGKSGTGPKAGGPLYLQRLQRIAEPPPGIASHAGPSAANTALAALKDWTDAHGHLPLAALCTHYLQTSLHGKTVTMPGPTGEHNLLRFAPRGVVLCAASAPAALLNQLAAVLATENSAVLLPRDAALLAPDLPAQVRARMRIIDAPDDSSEIAIALLDAGRINDVLPALAARAGPLVPAVVMAGNDAIPLWRLLAERAVCVNTTAAGGNASLMTLD